jgi:hypothetical protein
MNSSHTNLCVIVFFTLLAAGCSSFTPDQYVGEGIWMRGDGSTYEAPAPLSIVEARITNYRVDQNARTEISETIDEDGQKVIREKDIIEVDTGLDIEVELEEGSTYNIYLQGTGRVNQQSTSNASFTGPNGYIYTVAGTIYHSLDRPRVFVNITSKGPVQYRNTLVTD